MSKENILVFRPYPLQVGQKIHIDGGGRGGDWEIINVSDRKLKLRCPVSGREVEWDRFCYLVEERTDLPWPQKNE